MRSRRQYLAIRHRKAREEAQFVEDQMRAAERAALLLGLCPMCGANIFGGEPHATECDGAVSQKSELARRGAPSRT